MTITYQSARRIKGLSSDTKPTTPEIDSIFFETDTGRRFRWNGTVWKNIDLVQTLKFWGSHIYADINSNARRYTGLLPQTVDCHYDVSDTSKINQGQVTLGYAGKFLRLGQTIQIINVDRTPRFQTDFTVIKNGTEQSMVLTFASGEDDEKTTTSNQVSFTSTDKIGTVDKRGTAPTYAWKLASLPTSYGYWNATDNFKNQITDPRGIFFSPDMKRVFIAEDTTDKIWQYSTFGWSDMRSDLGWTWNRLMASFSFATQTTDIRAIFFKSDGLKLWVLSGSAVYYYTLSTAWDVTTLSYSTSKDVSGQESGMQGIYWKSDGTKMYVNGTVNNVVYEYDVSTAWDITTASYARQKSIAAQATFTRDIAFSSDGTKMYAADTVVGEIFEYDLSTAWDVTTATYNSNKKNWWAESLHWRSDGERLYTGDWFGTPPTNTTRIDDHVFAGDYRGTQYIEIEVYNP